MNNVYVNVNIVHYNRVYYACQPAGKKRFAFYPQIFLIYQPFTFIFVNSEPII